MERHLWWGLYLATVTLNVIHYPLSILTKWSHWWSHVNSYSHSIVPSTGHSWYSIFQNALDSNVSFISILYLSLHACVKESNLYNIKSFISFFSNVVISMTLILNRIKAYIRVWTWDCSIPRTKRIKTSVFIIKCDERHYAIFYCKT